MRLSRLLQDLSGTFSGFGEIGLAMLRNRLELFSIELKIEKMRLARLIILTILGSVFVLVSLILLTIALILAVDPVSRPSTIFWFGSAYLVVGGLVVFLAFKLNSKRKPFQASIEELQKDMEALK